MKRKTLALMLFAMIAVLAFSGCGTVNNNQNNQSNNTSGSSSNNGAVHNENNVSPVEEEEPNLTQETVTLYYSDDELMKMYRVKQEVAVESEEQLPTAALEAWMDGPQIDGLNNLVPPDVVLEKVEIKDGIAYVSFSKEIKNANLGSTGELFLLDQIGLIMNQFGAEKTQILIEGQIEESLLGHMTINEPYASQDPENYEWKE
ncbi:GerMN domain-containing protein [Marinicrinis lubricantis]|uniref:GerMN domain-containing protein n=1 Tax=Marinicrinis lubricantis TaxID=2086470 RepID=A0ABW1IV86_9BACL